MTLRKKAIENSNRYVSKDDLSHSEKISPISIERKKSASNNKRSQKNKNFIRNKTGGLKIDK